VPCKRIGRSPSYLLCRTAGIPKGGKERTSRGAPAIPGDGVPDAGREDRIFGARLQQPERDQRQLRVAISCCCL